MQKVHWILIRGLVREKRHWGDFPKILSKHFSKVSALELPGVGLRKNESSPINIEEYVDDLRKEFLKIKGSGPRALCAISMGGMIAQNWMSRYHDDFKCAVIINSSGGKLSPLYHRLTPAAFVMILNLFFGINIDTRVRSILEKTTNIIKIDDDLLDKWISYEQEYPTSRVNFLRQIMAAARFKVPKKLEVPTLFVASLKDQFVNSNCTNVLSKYYNAHKEFHPTAGHDIPLDDPSWLKDKLLSFYIQSSSGSKESQVKQALR